MNRALLVLLLLSCAACRDEGVEVGFWFEPVSFESPRLGGPLTGNDLRTIERVAMDEMGSAFAGLRVTFTDRRDARFRVHVVQELQDPRFSRPVGGAGQSRAVDGFGGWGAVSFLFVASGAVAFAPPDASRAEIVAAIGRGVARTAVHEITHQLLPRAPIHDTRNLRSYEYHSAARREHYYGEVEWDLARPLLERRVGLSSELRGEPNASSSH